MSPSSCIKNINPNMISPSSFIRGETRLNPQEVLRSQKVIRLSTIFPQPIQKLPRIQLPYPSINGYLVQGRNEQVVFMEFTKTENIPKHTHDSQWELVIAGTVDLTMNGTTQTFKKGDSFYIPKNIPHSATVHAGYHCVIFFDQKDRYQQQQ
jgi:quercetin dioxygenase-like cupin family protein